MDTYTRKEAMLNNIAEGQEITLEPKTREEYFLKQISEGKEVTLEPKTREEWFLKKISENCGGGSSHFDEMIEKYSVLNVLVSNAEVLTWDDDTHQYADDHLEFAYIPQATSIVEAFLSFDYLHDIYAPKLVDIGKNAFNNCTQLKTMTFPLVQNVGENAFSACTQLITLDFQKAESIGYAAFAGSTLKRLILRSSTMCNMDITAVINTNILTLDGVPTGKGFVYVPTALYESYVADMAMKAVQLAIANGSQLDEATATYMVTAILRKLEDYTLDGTVTGELDETKI